MNLRNWATPLAGAAFSVMSVTGLLMFFDLEQPQGKNLHKFLGWALVIGVALHVFTNWNALKLHFTRLPMRVLGGVALFLVVGGVLPLSSGDRGPNPVRAVMGSLSKVPLKDLAPVARRDVASIVADLKQAGFTDASSESTPDALAGDAREKRGQVLGIVFAAAR
jgi:hypothetical protein